MHNVAFSFASMHLLPCCIDILRASQIVVPSQFVMFNLSAIVGSAILYGDFKRASFHQIVTFLYGCAATFAGVFIIAWAPGGRGGEWRCRSEPRRAKGGQESRPELSEEETGLAQEEAELGLLQGEWWMQRGLVMHVA